MKSLLFTISMFLTILIINAQECLPEGIVFTTQEQINNFQSNYPGCTEIEGDVKVSSYANITNVNGLSALTSIGGDLKIYETGPLYSLSGFHNLVHIGGSLIFYDNGALSDISALSNISTLDGLFISGSDNLYTLTGLEGLTNIYNALDIQYTWWLEDINGLNNLVTVGSINIYKNYALTNLDGLASLTTVGGDVNISNNEILGNINGLSELNSIGGYLGIKNNESLISLTGLDDLESINGYLRIEGNPGLTSLNELSNINAGSISNLYIYDNAQLTDCAATSICDFLVSPNGTFDIHSNSLGCNSIEEVKESCGIFPCLPEGITFTTQEEVDSFPINYPSCYKIEGSVAIEKDALVMNLDSLYFITEIGGDFITHCSSLQNLNGLSNLIWIGGGLEIAGNAENLTNLEGLENLVSIDSSLIIYHTFLTNLNGLNNLTVIGDNLWIGSIEFNLPGQFGCLSNPNLTSLEGLENLTTIGGQLHVYCNDNLTDLSGLDNLTEVDGILIGEYGDDDCCGNNSLNSLSGLESVTAVGNYLQLVNNGLLSDISGLSNADFNTLDFLGISYNSTLSDCNIQNVCDYLLNSTGDIQVFNNASGCNSNIEVEDACLTVVHDMNNEDGFLISPNPCFKHVSLQFTIYEHDNVIVELIEISGVIAKTFIHEIKIPGSYELEIDLSDIQTGVYFCVLKTKEGVYTEKMIKL